MSLLNLFVTAPKGVETLLVDELTALGLQHPQLTRAGVACQGTLTQAYRACLWSRLANRVLLPLAHFPAPTPEHLYAGVQEIDWDEHFPSPDATLAIECTQIHAAIAHSRYAALKTKDAIVDWFREQYGVRPNVAVVRPDMPLHLHLDGEQATLSLDLSGDSLHRRGYRDTHTVAPLKENVAAALLLRAQWHRIAAEGGALVDPFCGSGTLAIEAAFIAGDIAPAYLRDYFGFLRWKQHNDTEWRILLKEAHHRRMAGLVKIPPIVGYDADRQAVHDALLGIDNAGLVGKIHVERRTLSQLTTLPYKAGLLIMNPPYGERLGEVEELKPLYQFLGETLKTQFMNWYASVFTGNIDLAKKISLRPYKSHTLYNGNLACKLLHFHVLPEWFKQERVVSHEVSLNELPSKAPAMPISPVLPERSDGVQMFANRLAKNLKGLQRWLQQEQVRCFRVYDADLPEYALAIDIYEEWVHVQEYAPPKTIPPEKAAARLREALPVIAEVLGKSAQQVFLKVRQRQRGLEQYQKLGQTGQFYEVHEGKAIFLVNFTDYLDTGLFLDHRPTRLLLYSLMQGKRFLNLFGYTGTATVHAALGGASATMTVDMSATYLSWAKRNLARNGLSEHRHEFVQRNCLEWLVEQMNIRFAPRYDVIFVDPPTFSNSKRMSDVFDVQRDYVELLNLALHRLLKGGVVYFSTNFQKFKFDPSAFVGVEIEDISLKTIPPDFARTPKIHYCWTLRRTSEFGKAL